MDITSNEFISEAMFFLFSDILLSGNGVLEFDVILLEDKDEALKLALDQNPPSGFCVWQDVIENDISEFFSKNSYSDAESFLKILMKISKSYKTRKI